MVESTYTVEGMSCDHCVRAVSAELAALPGVEGVDVDLGSGRVRVTSAAALDDGTVREAVAAAGYALKG